jgi:hypothetical protein
MEELFMPDKESWSSKAGHREQLLRFYQENGGILIKVLKIHYVSEVIWKNVHTKVIIPK